MISYMGMDGSMGCIIHAMYYIRGTIIQILRVTVMMTSLLLGLGPYHGSVVTHTCSTGCTTSSTATHTLHPRGIQEVWYTDGGDDNDWCVYVDIRCTGITSYHHEREHH